MSGMHLGAWPPTAREGRGSVPAPPYPHLFKSGSFPREASQGIGASLESHTEASSGQSVGELAKRGPAKTDPRLPSAGHRLLAEVPSVPLTTKVTKCPSPPGIQPPSLPQEVGLIVLILQTKKLRLHEVQGLI